MNCNQYCSWTLIALLMFSTDGFAVHSPLTRSPLTDSRWLVEVQKRDIGPDGAATAVRRATGGRVLTVTRTSKNTRGPYKVKVLLKGGRMQVLRVDAVSGALQ